MTKQLYVGNLGPQADGEMLKKLFSVFGEVENAYIISDKQTGQSKGYGFVHMTSEEHAQTAIQALDGKKCGDFTVRVKETKGKN